MPSTSPSLRTTLLKNVAFFQEGPGLRTHQWSSEGMKVINVTNIIGDGSVDITNTDKFVSLRQFENRYLHFAVEENDIVVASSGNTYGKAGRIRAEHLPLMMNTSVIRFHSLDKNCLDDDFLYAWLRSPEFRNQIEKFVTGGAQPNFGPTHLKQMQITLFEPQLQRKIGSIVSAYDELIENNRRRISLLEEAARMLYREWFLRYCFPGHEHVKIIEGIPEGWERRVLDQIVDIVSETVKPSDFKEDDVHIGLEHIPRRSFTLADWEPAQDLASHKMRFRAGDILFGKIRPYFHKVGFALRDGLASSDALVWRVRNEADWPLVVCATSSDLFVAVASKTVREGSKMPRADWNVLKNYSIPKPPDGLLGVFNDTIRPITAQCRTLSLQNRALAEARDILLPRLMNGEIAV